MISARDPIINASAFTEYDSYVDADFARELIFLSPNERRRYVRYALLFGLTHNFSHAVRTQRAPTVGDKDTLDSVREYGEPGLIATLTRDALLSGVVHASTDGAPEINEVWARSGLGALIANTELKIGSLGDGFYHLFLHRPGQWRVESLDPRQVVIQEYNRELRHVVIWKYLSPTRLENGTQVPRIWTLEYALRSAGEDVECWWRETTWAVTRNVPAMMNLTTPPFDLSQLTFLTDEVALRRAAATPGEVQFSEGPLGPSWVPLVLNDGRTADFIPVVHLPNIDSGEVLGLSDLHKGLNTLFDLGPVNQRLQTGTRLLALPPVGVEDSAVQYSDLRPQRLGADPADLPTQELKPGTIMAGKVYLVDTSKLFSALLEQKKHLYQTLFAVCQTPEIAFNPAELRVTAAAGLRIMFQPLINLVQAKRLEREPKYTLLLKFILKAYGRPTEVDGKAPTVIFGDLASWVDARITELVLAATNGIATKLEVRRHLERAGVLVASLLEADFTPSNNSGLDLNSALGRGRATPAAGAEEDEPAQD